MCLYLLSNRVFRRYPRRVNKLDTRRRSKGGRVLETNLHRSFAPSHSFLRRPAVVLQTTAWDSACNSCMLRSHRSSVPNVSGRLQAGRGALGKIESSRRTRRGHIRTRSCTARWSCFRTAILRLDSAVGILGCPMRPKSLTHTCISRGRVGKLWESSQAVNGRGGNGVLRFPSVF